MPFKVSLLPAAKKDCRYWKKRDLKIARKIVELLKNLECDPFTSIGKPEPLKHDLQGYWSSHITEKKESCMKWWAI